MLSTADDVTDNLFQLRYSVLSIGESPILAMRVHWSKPVFGLLSFTFNNGHQDPEELLHPNEVCHYKDFETSL